MQTLPRAGGLDHGYAGGFQKVACERSEMRIVVNHHYLCRGASRRRYRNADLKS